MNANAKKAYEALRAIGAPVLGPEMGWGGYFAISGEAAGADDIFYKGSKEFDPDGTDWAEYYRPDFGLFGVSTHITNLLDEHGLYCEWVNAAVLSVHDA
jgi:hypothetical protein